MGERFARALAAKDAAGLKALLRSDVDFRALTPGRAWESTDAGVIVDETILGTWFDDSRSIVELLAVDTDAVGDVERVGCRFRIEQHDGEYVLEQQAYLRADGERIGWLRILCTGFLPTGTTA